MTMTGTGALTGFNRNIDLPIIVELHSGPRTPGDPIQTFATELIMLQGVITGDPNFDQLQLVAGSSFGLPSPGQATLTELGGGLYHVDSFFDVTYQIDFTSTPGSILEGMSGTTTGTARITAGDVCVIGACCLPDGSCEQLSEFDCETQGGVYQGNEVDCISVDCPQPGMLIPLFYLDKTPSSMIIKSPDGSCYQVTVRNDGTLITTKVNCPD